MLLNLNRHYFSWDTSRIADIIIALDHGNPFIAYPGVTRVESNGSTTTLSLDGHSVVMSNTELSDFLTNVKKEVSF
jgi:hypothetical protein